MSGVFFTSDQHFGHARILEQSQRPFMGIEDHDLVLVERWNSVVRRADDIVWVLGDFTSEGSTERGLSYLPQLNGRKRLVTGNHDRAWMGKSDAARWVNRYLDAGFELVTPFARAKVGAIKVNLSHFPYAGDHSEIDRHQEYRLRPSDRPILHGHTHSARKWSLGPRLPTGRVDQIHVGVDAWNYRPVSVLQVEAILTKGTNP